MNYAWSNCQTFWVTEVARRAASRFSVGECTLMILPDTCDSVGKSGVSLLNQGTERFSEILKAFGHGCPLAFHSGHVHRGLTDTVSRGEEAGKELPSEIK